MYNFYQRSLNYIGFAENSNLFSANGNNRHYLEACGCEVFFTITERLK